MWALRMVTRKMGLLMLTVSYMLVMHSCPQVKRLPKCDSVSLPPPRIHVFLGICVEEGQTSLAINISPTRTRTPAFGAFDDGPAG